MSLTTPLRAVSRDVEPAGELMARLRPLALRSLGRMYRPDERLFVFRVRAAGRDVVAEGLSRRYSAISVIGMAEDESVKARAVLGGHDLHDVCGRLMSDVSRLVKPGDVALILWAAAAAGYADRQWARDRLVELAPAEGAYQTVPVAWSLAALCADAEAPVGDLRERLARRLMRACSSISGIFPHGLGEEGGGLRAHVACFADLVYPVHALALYHRLTGDPEAARVATRCAEQFCRRQGPDGQWWWHYDRRTGAVVEGYPVYAVHQDAMAPMALFALGAATSVDYSAPIARGLAWLARSPELRGGSLVDEAADLIWRKVARREPGKLSRYAQAMVSSVHAGMRVPGLDLVFPPVTVDREDRPYHLGWLLYAWPARRVAAWRGDVGPR
ncbi:MAG TPA: hypothetical protein VMT79_21990 [Candidatus Binatia bacterium]|nr:hypothetical protein [Candidatus Binatia bacterium]